MEETEMAEFLKNGKQCNCYNFLGGKRNENNVTITNFKNDVIFTIFYWVSNSHYFLSLNDAALVCIKDKFQNDDVYFGQMLGAKEPEPQKT
jgi:hypothetical protein